MWGYADDFPPRFIVNRMDRERASHGSVAGSLAKNFNRAWCNCRLLGEERASFASSTSSAEGHRYAHGATARPRSIPGALSGSHDRAMMGMVAEGDDT